MFNFALCKARLNSTSYIVIQMVDLSLSALDRGNFLAALTRGHSLATSVICIYSPSSKYQNLIRLHLTQYFLPSQLYFFCVHLNSIAKPERRYLLGERSRQQKSR